MAAHGSPFATAGTRIDNSVLVMAARSGAKLRPVGIAKRFRFSI